ncbi:TPA: hypothetical protein QCN90_005325 [Bacillus pacificus]|uniref:Uncharacterized protein n=4 Tax=Bacillus cereus group TaxID=86661 RepID=A0A5M9GKY5_9BACI|nr:putative lipoprotein [Bacillus cereus AH187]ACK92795.1 lipoprotein, putative [Bacillus cereus AH820]EEK97217.1 hypothetical protein bcere0013_56290 [Bacillus cereus BDRD-ST26]KAA8473368.1 hypothetical protein FYW06_27315 [Bacillus paranthracis]PCC76469.1 hypothetical protein CNQ76_27690 [Bacillus cereus]QHH87686.1 hypothetical protein FPL01_01575 [Bacillus pacificus]
MESSIAVFKRLNVPNNAYISAICEAKSQGLGELVSMMMEAGKQGENLIIMRYCFKRCSKLFKRIRN